MLTLKNKMFMTAAAIGVLSTGGLVTSASAQNNTAPPPAQQQQQINVDEAQLHEFAAAEAAVRQVQTKYEGQAQAIETQEEMQTLQQQASREMVQAIQSTDLTVQEYNQIANLVQADPQLREKYMEMVR